jgi:hypothetical protein
VLVKYGISKEKKYLTWRFQNNISKRYFKYKLSGISKLRRKICVVCFVVNSQGYLSLIRKICVVCFVVNSQGYLSLIRKICVVCFVVVVEELDNISFEYSRE